MKKLLGGVLLVALLSFFPMATSAISLEGASEVLAKTTEKFKNINVTGYIINKAGVLKLKDKVNIKKRLRLKTNLDVRGKILNKKSGEAVKIDDQLTVEKKATLKNGLKLTGINTSGLDTTNFGGGDIYYNSSDDKLYLWNGTSWVDLTQQNTNTTYTGGTGLNLNSGEFTINQGFSPTWTGNHTFNNNILAQNSVVAGSTTYGDGSIVQATGGPLNIALGKAAGDDFIVNTDTFVVESDNNRVGIGDATPDNFLDIEADEGGVNLVSINNTATNGYGLEIRTTNTSGSNQALSIFSGVTPSFTVTNDGDVIIGDDQTPVSTLDIEGFMKLDQYLLEPMPCNAGTNGSIAYTGAGALCLCNGSDWKKVEEPGTDCAWTL